MMHYPCFPAIIHKNSAAAATVLTTSQVHIGLTKSTWTATRGNCSSWSPWCLWSPGHRQKKVSRLLLSIRSQLLRWTNELLTSTSNYLLSWEQLLLTHARACLLSLPPLWDRKLIWTREVSLEWALTLLCNNTHWHIQRTFNLLVTMLL